MKKIIKTKRFWITMLIPVSVCLILCAKYISGFADFYLDNIYRYISLVLNNITGIFPFSLAEIIVIISPIALTAYLTHTIIKIIKSKQKSKILLNCLLNLLCIVSVVLFTFTTNCGINYYSSDIAQTMNINKEPVSTDELYKVCVYLAQRSSDIRTCLVSI